MAFKIENGVLKKYTEEDGVTEVVIPDSVTTIGEGAFSYCFSLTSVTIPDSVTTIGDSAFSYCSSLTSVTIPDSVTTIGQRAFYETKWLEKYPEDLVIVGNGILIEYKGNDKNVVIPDSVTTIGKEAFHWCSSLTTVTIPDSVTTIGYRAFYECSSLTTVTIPDSVTTIGKEAFYGTKWLGEYPEDLVIVGNGILIIYKGNDENVVIPDSVTTIGDWAFDWCKSLTTVTIPDSVTTIGEAAFIYCESLTSVTIPDSVTTIGDSAFWGCKSLTTVTIPDSVTTIGDSAFFSCKSLTTVTIPDSVTTIGGGAFLRCESLTTVRIKGITFKADYKKFGKNISEAYKLPETKDFSARLYSPLKTAVIVGYYLESGDADSEEFIKKNIKKIMTFLIDGDNVGTILKLLETGKFVTAKNIITFIDYANSLQKMEIQLIFMNYSHEHFKPKKPKLKL